MSFLKDEDDENELYKYRDAEEIKKIKELDQKKDAESCYQLSLMFQYGLLNGLLNKQKEQKRFDLLTLAANQGHAVAQNELGSLYHKGGLFVPEKDEKKAFDLYSISSKQNLEDAIFNLASCYEFGYGTTKNIAESTRLWSSIGRDRKEIVKPYEAEIEENRRIEKEIEQYFADFAQEREKEIEKYYAEFLLVQTHQFLYRFFGVSH